MDLSTHAGSRVESRAKISENVYRYANTIPPVYDEEKSGPQSCPSTFGNTKQPQFTIDKLRQLRSNELVASKLLPTRTSVNSLMGYVRELQLSEATLRKQLVKTKQHTEEELSQSLSKVSELERTMMEVERDRKLARRKLEEQEKLIRDLAAQLKQAESAKTKGISSGVDELPPIAEETPLGTPLQAGTEAKTVATDEEKPETPIVSPLARAPTSPVQPSLPPTHQKQAPLVRVELKENNRAAQFGLTSPRSPNRPLWDPWASGGATPMKNLPPVFRIGSTSLDPGVAVGLPTSTTQASTTGTATTAPGDYELKSVLMSPRRDASENGHAAQQVEHNESSVAQQQEFSPQYPGAIFAVGAVPSPSHSQQDDFSLSEVPGDAYGAQDQEEDPLLELPAQADPMVRAETVADNSFEQQEAKDSTAENDCNSTEWNKIQAQQTTQPSAVSCPPVAETVTKASNETMAPVPSFVEQSVSSPLPQADTEDAAPDVATPHNEGCNGTQPEQASTAEVESLVTTCSLPSIALLGPTRSPPRPVSDAQPPCPVKEECTEPVSLEKLLLDFFTEVDKKRLKMATVYGKRYAGREKWLFTELAKRYGAAKVAALKARYEHGTDVSTGDNSGDKKGKRDDHATKSSDSSGRSKASRQGHPQFFHPPKPACNANPGAGKPRVSLPVAPSQENDAPNSQPGQEIEAKAPPSPSEKVSRSNTPAFGDPPSLPTTQKSDESDNAVKANIDGPSVTNRPPLAQRDKPSGSLNQPPPPLHRGMETSNSAPVGLRQRHNASGPSAQGPKTDGTERPAVTVEGLLKELYKNHQPDKLKNVYIVAKEYAGKERELVGLLKGKYGALSVKRLEENLEILERAHRDCIAGKGAGKKRGCFVRTISLLLWLSVLLYFSFGAVFVSFVVLDAWECRALDKDGQELESAEECVPLQEELDAFTYEHVADYIRQSHPDICFCSEWKARENALFTTLSGDDLMNLARLVPFSPDSFGSAWIASVKEQAPSQECYNNYAKPVVDLWLDVGSFLWSSVLELAGYDEVCEVKSQTVESVVENENPLVDEESDSNTDAGSLEQASEEMENESSISEVEIDPDLTEETKADGQLTEETETNGGFVPADEVPVEEETLRFDDGPQIGEEESLLFGPEVVDKTSAQVSEDVEAVEKAESVDAIVEALTEYDSALALHKIEEAELDADTKSTGVDGTAVVEDDSVITTPVEETDAIDRGADAASSSVTVEVVDTAVDVSEEEESVVEEGATELNDVVEIEVFQEGVDLSYAETVTDVTKEELIAESTEGSSTSALEAELEPVVDVDEGLPSRISKAEAEMNVELKNIAVDSLKEPVSVGDTAEEVAKTTTEVTGSDADVFSGADVEMENVEEELDRTEKLEVGVALSEEGLDTVVGDVATVDSSIPADVDEVLVLESEDKNGEDAASALGEENEVEAEKIDLDAAIEIERETDDGEEVFASEEDHPREVVDEDIVAEREPELSPSSSEVDAVELLSDESSVSVLIEGLENGKGESKDEKPAATPIAVWPEVADKTWNEEDATVAASSDEDDLAIPVEAEDLIHDLEPEEDVAKVVDETLVQEQVEELEREACGRQEDVEDSLTVSAEIEPAVVKKYEVDAGLFFPSENGTGSVEVGLDEEDEVENGNPGLSSLSHVEVEKSVAAYGLVSEQGEEFLTIEATEASVEPDADALEPVEFVTEQIEHFENAVETDAIDDTESTIAVERDTPGAVPADEEAPEADHEALVAERVPESEEAPVIDERMVSVENADEIGGIADETEPNQVAAKSSTTASEEEESGGLASAVNEVLARLVEPFEAAKTATSDVATEGMQDL
ncbi:hypothetical protein PInf_002693 [Phytophthora infestans]|nr:hypothetical protein PInf_002693 [Phytophthora infestans]